jgi:hypothetical protein
LFSVRGLWLEKFRFKEPETKLSFFKKKILKSRKNSGMGDDVRHWQNDIQHNDTQHKDTQYNGVVCDIQHNDAQYLVLLC